MAGHKSILLWKDAKKIHGCCFKEEKLVAGPGEKENLLVHRVPSVLFGFCTACMYYPFKTTIEKKNNQKRALHLSLYFNKQGISSLERVLTFEGF